MKYLLLRKTDVLKTLISKFTNVDFWRATTHVDTIEFSNFLLQFKNQRSGSKTLGGFSIILILKAIIKF